MLEPDPRGVQRRESSWVVWTGRAVLALALGVFAAALAWAAKGLRGTDQYWYAADLVNAGPIGDASNHLYPSFSLPEVAAGAHDLPPRIHGVPVTWAAEALFGLGVSDYHAWVITNAFLALATAALCYWAARMLGLGRSAVWAPALFLAFPLTTWLTLNALAEMSVAFLAGLLLVGVVAAERTGARWGLVAAAVAAGLLFWTRENFVLVVLCFLVYGAWLQRRRGWPVLTVALAGLVALGFVVTRSLVFAKYPTGSLAETLMVSAPGTGETMSFYYSTVDFDLQAFLTKVVSGAVSAVVPSGVVELVTELPLVLGVVGAAVLLRKKADKRVLLAWLAAMSATYVATCMLFQSQNRYIYVLLPITSVAVALVIGSAGHQPRRSSTWLPAVGVLGVLTFVAGSALMAHQYRASAVEETASTQALQDELGTTRGALLATGNNAATISVAYAAAPRVVLVADPVLNTTDEVSQLLTHWEAGAVLGPSSDGPFLTAAVQQAFPGADLVELGTAPTPGGEVTVWEIRADEGSAAP
jgi:hypothetical protein